MKKTWSRVLATVLVLAMVLCMPGFAASVADTTDFESDRATSADELTDADLPELLSASGNHYPIVLVHGLFGWGGTEVLGLNYWGGFSSLRDILNNAGYKVYTPSIGPVASNWDRACELYAYLVGGTVDYGAYHSATNGHARYGRTFPGVLPELNNPDSELKVHLVGHSMGGETIRMLAQLLENGDADERNASRGGDISPPASAATGSRASRRSARRTTAASMTRRSIRTSAIWPSMPWASSVRLPAPMSMRTTSAWTSSSISGVWCASPTSLTPATSTV